MPEFSCFILDPFPQTVIFRYLLLCLQSFFSKNLCPTIQSNFYSLYWNFLVIIICRERNIFNGCANTLGIVKFQTLGKWSCFFLINSNCAREYREWKFVCFEFWHLAYNLLVSCYKKWWNNYKIASMSVLFKQWLFVF